MARTATPRRRSTTPRTRPAKLTHEVTFDSIAAAAAAYHSNDGVPGDGTGNPDSGGRWREEFYGVGSYDELRHLAEHGWQDVEADAMAIVESVIDGVERTHDLDTFTPVYDVTGGAVDVGRFLSGEPECMVDYLPVPTTDVGRVITLCASVTYSGAVDVESIKRRGHTVAALAFALTRIGLAVELWADMSAGNSSVTHRARVLVKGANDELDVARIMFAFTHPAMLRGIGFGVMNSYPENIRDAYGRGLYGSPVDPKRDLPDGTIYLPSICSSHDVPDAYLTVVSTLRELGVLGPED
jgi:hypothetical protein